MKAKWEIAKLICTDDEIRLYRWVNSPVQMSKTVRTDECDSLPQRIYSSPVADLLITSCGFTHYQLRIYS